MKLLNSYGGIWKLSNRAYKQLLSIAASGKAWDLNEHGKYIGNVINVTDMDKEIAEELLKELRS